MEYNFQIPFCEENSTSVHVRGIALGVDIGDIDLSGYEAFTRTNKEPFQDVYNTAFRGIIYADENARLNVGLIDCTPFARRPFTIAYAESLDNTLCKTKLDEFMRFIDADTPDNGLEDCIMIRIFENYRAIHEDLIRFGINQNQAEL